MQPSVDSGLESVKGEINFAPRFGEEQGSAGSGAYGASKYKHEVRIHNARPILSQLSLDQEGFVLVQHKTLFADVRDPQVLREKYIEEMTPFIKDYFRASWVIPRSDAIFVRRAGLPKKNENEDTTDVYGVRLPALTAHIDYTPISGPMVAARENQMRGIPIRSYSRLMIINTWRAVSPPPQDQPLAVCDARSVNDADIMAFDYTDPESGNTWRTGNVRYSARHLWYYFPEMTADEVLLFKGYDSERTYWVAHSSFDNRSAYPNANRRDSIEARFYVYYE